MLKKHFLLSLFKTFMLLNIFEETVIHLIETGMDAFEFKETAFI